MATLENSASAGIEFAMRIAAEESQQLDVAWDAIHQAGWTPDRVYLRRFTGEMRAQIVLRAGRSLLADLAVFEVATHFDYLTVVVTPTWLTAIPPP